MGRRRGRRRARTFALTSSMLGGGGARNETNPMSVSEPFIRRPIATSLLGLARAIGARARLLGVVGLGTAAGRFPTVQVTTHSRERAPTSSPH